VTPAATLDKARRQAEQQQVANVFAQQEMAAYIDILKQKAKVKFLKPIAANVASADAKDSGASDTK
jgi:peptidyl-prolyl cis-trans isomerase D